jgi:AcrR family transcriptional regulator
MMMEAMGLREEKKERQRREILDAALALFRERGYDDTRVRDIVDRVRISEATFFNYFPDKASLLQEFALGQVGRYGALLGEELGRDESVPHRIRDMMRVMARAIAADRELQTVIFTRSRLFRASGHLKQEELRTYAQLADLFATGQRRGEIRSDVHPVQLAEVLTGIFQLTTTNWLTGWWEHEREDLEERLSRAIDVFLTGCQTPSR